MTPPTIDPNAKVPATLSAQQWNIVLAALQELPHRLSHPILVQLSEQLEAAAAMAALTPPAPEADPTLPRPAPEPAATEMPRPPNGAAGPHTTRPSRPAR